MEYRWIYEKFGKARIQKNSCFSILLSKGVIETLIQSKLNLTSNITILILYSQK